MKTRTRIGWGILIICIIFSLAFGTKIVETNKKGHYQVKQAAITGTMTARMKPGTYLQNFGDIQTWPFAETFYFTADSSEGSSIDQSIRVRFNDGSESNISGTLRIQLPPGESQAIALVTDKSYKSFNDLEHKLILPVVRNALRTTANLMSARESYSEKRTDFTFYAWDQIQNGLYKTKEEVKKVKDPISGELVTKTYKVINTDKEGNIIREKNPLEGLGITLANFEIKDFVYTEKVNEQIKTQQEAIMAVATAKAEATKAEQDKLKIEAEGKAMVATARYEKEQEKIKAVVTAEQKKEVAKLDMEAASFYKQSQILKGEGEAARKKKVMLADGALDKKLKAYVEVQRIYAQEFGKQKWVPEVMLGGTGGQATGASNVATMMDVLTLKALKDLNLDMKVPKGGNK